MTEALIVLLALACAIVAWLWQRLASAVELARPVLRERAGLEQENSW